MKRITLAVLISASILLPYCSGDKDDAVDTPPPGNNCDDVNSQFAAHVQPILSTSCATNASCHGAGSVNGPGPLLNFTQAKNAAAIIKAAVVSGRMPQNGTLSTAQKNTISCWVDGGAPNN
ncbi:MAG: hypothetical protein ACXWV5_04715 [Flavitalea sp.]